MERGVWDQDMIIRLDPDEEIHASIQNIMAEIGYHSGAITSGIGRVRDVDIGYLADDGIYQRKFIQESVELLSLQGNIAELDGKPFTHIHVVVSDDDHVVHGGHLFSAVVEVTAEIHVRLIPINGELGISLTRCHLEGSDFKPLNFTPVGREDS
ncbi:MAG: DUF296 domain-containing protein [Candidatus Poseidoniales archaeon]|nr:DUF296 domain-containing protein [Candidatus Poseidoniales archaeon]